MKHQSYKAFTLIELLVVIAIIGILTALLFPAVQKAISTSEIKKAETTVMQLATSFRAYQSEYGVWPSTDTGNVNLDSSLVKVLFGENIANKNPRKIIFLEAGTKEISAAGDFLDPWGRVYLVKFDQTQKGELSSPFEPGKMQTVGVMVWSVGPDGQADTTGDTSKLNKDNPKSW